MLHIACSRDIIGRPYSRSTAVPWTFMAMSVAPVAMPNVTKQSASDGDIPGQTQTTSDIAPRPMAHRSTNAPERQPTSGGMTLIAPSNPMGVPMSAMLSSAVLSPS
jgi:hypothetical protein